MGGTTFDASNICGDEEYDKQHCSAGGQEDVGINDKSKRSLPYEQA